MLLRHTEARSDQETEEGEIIAYGGFFTHQQSQNIIKGHHDLFTRVAPTCSSNYGRFVDPYYVRHGKCPGLNIPVLNDARTHARERANFLAGQRAQVVYTLLDNFTKAPLSIEALEAFRIEVAAGQAEFENGMKLALTAYEDVLKRRSISIQPPPGASA